MKFLPYLRMARPDNWFKNIFMAPGVLLALFFDSGLLRGSTLLSIVLGFVSACLIASSNYLLNEILDARHDSFHPEKRFRPMPSGQAMVLWAYMWYGAFTILGLTVGFMVGPRFGICGLLLWGMGILYNAPPARLKDVPYLDVLSEAINNPIRLGMGWYATGLGSAPPLSVVMAYWMFGCFLMAVKRFAEYRRIADHGRAGNYRKSFRHYSEESLLESIMFYAAFFAMMSGVFVTRYRIELVLATPPLAYCMAYYLHLGLKPDSPAQYPERLFRQKKLAAIVCVTFALCGLLLFVDLPAFDHLFDPWILPSR